VVFSKIVCNIFDAWCPVDAEVSLFDTVAYPLKAHVNRFGPHLFHSSVHDAAGSRVVCFHWGGWLGMPHFIKRGTDDGGFLGVEVQGANFGFGGGGHDTFEDFGDIENGPVNYSGFAREVAKIVVAAGSAASFGFRDIGCVAVNV
jgi:hypothetical protein